MNIEFATDRLSAASLSLSEATRLFSVPIGRKFIQRLAVLRATEEFSQRHGHRALRLHPLKGRRDGQHAMTLTGNFRLIVEQITQDAVRILGVEDYHGD